MQAWLISLSLAVLNYVIQEYTGTGRYFPSLSLCGLLLKISEGKETCISQ